MNEEKLRRIERNKKIGGAKMSKEEMIELGQVQMEF